MDSVQERVLFVAPFEPWCRENGSSVVIADLLEGLYESPAANLYQVFLRDPPHGCPPSGPSRANGVTLGLKPLPKWLSVMGQLLIWKSPWELRLPNRRVARAIAEHVRDAEFSPTVVHVEHLVLVDIGRKLADMFQCPLVYRAHNVESQLWGRRLALNRPLARRLLRRFERREADAIATCQLTLCISDVDLAWVRAHSPDARARVLPVGLSFDRFDRLRTNGAAPRRQVCFVGGLEWGPNEAGLRWFVDEVLPRIEAEVEGAQLVVLARGAASRTWLTDNPRVQILPQSGQSLALFADSSVSVAPLLEGGGVRVKIIESLAVGCPVVATSIGGEGLSLPGLTHTDDPVAFAAACVRYLRAGSTPDSRSALRESVRAKHGAAVVAADLVESWARVSTGSN